MKKVYIRILLLSIITSFPFLAYSQEEGNSKKKPFCAQVFYTGDNVNNLSGGIKTGSCYLGMAKIQAGFDTEKAKVWKGGQFFVTAANTHGSLPSLNLLGDMQIASNIEAGNHTYLQELWIKQLIGNVEFTAGLQDLNVEFASSKYGGLYLNSSFGVLPTISGNIAAPIFPLTTLGLTIKWIISKKYAWVTAFYDGCPTDFNDNPHNVNWKFVSGDGLLSISEFQYTANSGIYKIGLYSHNHFIERSLDKNIPDSLNYNIMGLYNYIDQKIWQHDQKSLGLFMQLGYSPSDASLTNYYFGVGINYTGLLNKKGNDVVGIALAYENFNSEINSETAIELTYQYQLNKYLFIQPDFQYIINPAGTGITLNNSFSGNIRFGISL